MIVQLPFNRILRSRSASLKARAAQNLPPPPAKKRHSHIAPESAFTFPSKRAPLGALILPDANVLRGELLHGERLPHSLPPARKAGAARKTPTNETILEKNCKEEKTPEGNSKRRRKTEH